VAVYPSPAEMEEVTLLDVVDTALEKGVVLQGDATISVADVDLVFLGLKLVLASVDTLNLGRRSGTTSHSTQGDGNNTDQALGVDGLPCASPAESRRDHGALEIPPKREREEPSPDQCMGASAAESDTPSESRKPWADPDKVEQGLAKLVLTVVELLRQLLERQALRRMEHGSLTDDEIERMGITFQRLEEKMEELKGVFGLAGEELNLNLGPLGNLT